LDLMRSKTASIGLALLFAATAVAGCGDEGQPKRAVDARNEVLGFFAADAPVVAVLRPLPAADLVALDRAGAGSPVSVAVRGMVLGPLHVAGLGRRRLARLVEPQEEIEGVAASSAALGAPTPEDLAAKRPLLILATDQDELLTKLLDRAAEDGKLRRAGRLDKATLYRAPSQAFAARDGVLVSAQSLGQVRTAIGRRDGDSDQQLDEDVVHSLFNDLDPQGPLLVYADLAEVREVDAGLRALGKQAPWTGELGPTGASVRAVDGSLRIEDFSKTTGGDLDSGEVPIGTEPSKFEIVPSSVPALIPGAGPVRELLTGLGPLQGEATASSDEVRINLNAGG
jgi:hypothetical protein